MKHLPFLLVAPVFALGLCGVARADDRPAHFKGEQAATLDEALAHLATYNAQLRDILARDELGPEDTAKSHERTYPLGNALGRIESEVEAMAESLEDVHVASERFELETVRTQGRRYLDASSKLVR
jgi:hypothetical protein